MSTALGSLTAASLLSGSVVSFAEHRRDSAVEDFASIVAVRPIEIELGRSGADVTALDVDLATLAPGGVHEACVVVIFPGDDRRSKPAGAVGPADLRITGRIDLTARSVPRASALIEVGAGSRADCADFDATATLYAGGVSELAALHGSHLDGLRLAPRAMPGDAVTFRLVVSLPPSEPSPSGGTPFWIDVEARIADEG